MSPSVCLPVCLCCACLSPSFSRAIFQSVYRFSSLSLLFPFVCPSACAASLSPGLACQSVSQSVCLTLSPGLVSQSVSQSVSLCVYVCVCVCVCVCISVFLCLSLSLCESLHCPSPQRVAPGSVCQSIQRL